MIKVSVMYPNQPGGRFDHDYYRDKHMPLVAARMGALPPEAPRSRKPPRKP